MIYSEHDFPLLTSDVPTDRLLAIMDKMFHDPADHVGRTVIDNYNTCIITAVKIKKEPGD